MFDPASYFRGLCVASALVACLPAVSPGQNAVPLSRSTIQVTTPDGKVISIDPSDVGSFEVSGEMIAPPVGEEGTEAAAAGEPSPRLEKLTSATYDRRPSTILRVWSGLSEKERAEAEAAAKKAEEEAKAAAAEAATTAGTDGEATPDTETTESTEAVAPEAVPAEIPATTTETPAAEAPATEGESTTPAAGSEVDPAAAAEAEAAKAKEEEERKAAELKAIEEEIRTLQKNVTLGRWADVKAYFAGLKKAEAEAGYKQMVASLSMMPDQPTTPTQMVGESNRISLADLLGIAAASPKPLEKEGTVALAPLLQLAMTQGAAADEAVEFLREQSARPAEEQTFSKKHAIWLLVAISLLEEVDEFLPDYDTAVAAQDAESLILLARSRAREYAKEGKPEQIEEAWKFILPVRGFPELKLAQREEATGVMLSLLPKLRDELGAAWLAESFGENPELGMEIIAATGATTANALLSRKHMPDQRLEDLKIQHTVVTALLEKSPERAQEWADVLRMMADSWLREAEVSQMYDQSISKGPSMQRDMWGNMYYMEMGYDYNQNYYGDDVPQPIRSTKLLEFVPGEAWLAFVGEELRPAFDKFQAQLNLKISEETAAFPFIERLAPEHPKLAAQLVNEFITTWTTNHDPNAASRYTSSYMYMFGYDQRADGIPLTRSKQERNIQELSGWVVKIRALNLEDVDESLLGSAFTTCHSSAEVYKLEAIEEVFGDISQLDSKLLFSLLTQMRANLSSVWRLPATQEQAKTKRRQQDIQVEVLQGYQTAMQVAAQGLSQRLDDWRMMLALATLQLDAATYQNQLAPSSEFADRRLATMELFQRAAAGYAAEVPTLKAEEQEATVFEHWFYAGLGASDISNIDHESVADPRQPPMIREAILALPGEAAEKHMSLFANSLFTRMSGLKPQVKFGYLKAGFEIVGDHEQAYEARHVYDYYRDLVSEIQLVTRLDGPAEVGHGEPFGVFVELRHTIEIERESGGFSKYLQNQNSMMFAWNYGRPLENYRDKFEEQVRTAMADHFEVKSITFEDAEVHSRSDAEYGWRRTPYAYLLLAAKGPETDEVPPLKLDLDFLDTSGYAVLPVTSSTLQIDATGESPPVRPYGDVTITQTLDERQASDGKLILEVKATASGLVPPLEELLSLEKSDFEVAGVEDEGVLVSKFDEEKSEPTIASERTWMVSYAGSEGLPALPTEFTFPEPRAEAEVKENAYMMYDDADLKTVEQTVSLAREYGDVEARWPYYAGGGLAAFLALGVAWKLSRRGPAVAEDVSSKLPERLTPFNVLAILRDIEAKNGFTPPEKQELAGSIGRIEREYFANVNGSNGNGHEDLRQVAERWVGKSRR
jgi:hypothetical protein